MNLTTIFWTCILFFRWNSSESQSLNSDSKSIRKFSIEYALKIRNLVAGFAAIQSMPLPQILTADATTFPISSSQKAFLITGSTEGIGKHTAFNLARDGYTVLIHGRSPEKIERVKREIKTKLPQAKLRSYCRDLSTMSNAKLLAADILADNTRLDGVINNAGVFNSEYELTSEGLESTFAINVLAPFIISLLLLPLLSKTPQSRIINVSSTSQEEGDPKIVLNNLQFQRGGFSGHASYSLSKLCLAAISNELARRVSSDNTLIFSCDPGDVDTAMLRAGWPDYRGKRIEDADDEYELATHAWDPKWHGKYFVGLQETTCNKQVYDSTLQQGLWTELEHITGIKYPAP